MQPSAPSSGHENKLHLPGQQDLISALYQNKPEQELH